MGDWWEWLSAAIIQVIALKNRSHKLNKQPIQDYKASFSARRGAVQAGDGARVAPVGRRNVISTTSQTTA